MVLQEERNHNNGCRRERSGFMPKKHKANKVPQRGLGIAALEKLRREDQQSRIAGWFSAGDNTTTATASTGGSVHLSSGVISPAPFLPALEQSTKPCFFGSSPLFGNSVQSESSSISSSRLPLLPRKLQEGQQRYSLLIRNFLSPPMSSGASLQIEPPSNQSYVSINPPSMPVQKRSWAFHPGSALESGNDPKRIALSSSSCSRIKVGAEAEASKLDGSLLSLGLLPVSEPSSMQTIPFHKHYAHNLQHIQKNREENISEAIGPPTLYNFMGLPHDLINEADTESKDEF
ncbi:uncharacterized protein LOC110035902 isoform X3 [Phalaenopsis equestris]|uniref:uncharacterized protein LOC110035902 isoform X3 n=1 Tax=Phalaenopsis equestris TaxID=78828 RepID=UPI0009E29594|nr:uncharacterized protein LOC110035902 isoform X3 [Phalaenopsis equestris]